MNIQPGMKVKIVSDDGTEGMFVNPQYIQNRKIGMTGIVKGWVPGHGGDVWFVEHDDNSVAVYCFTELKKIE